MNIDNNEQFDNGNRLLLEIKREIFIQNVSRRLRAAAFKKRKGFTFDIHTMSVKTCFPRGVYIVGQNGHGKRSQKIPKLSEFIEWVEQNLNAILTQGVFDGGWWNNEGLFCLDMVTTVVGRKRAFTSRKNE